MDSVFLLINKIDKATFSSLCFIFILLNFGNTLAGGGDTDPNEDMSLSLIYDPEGGNPAPISLIARKLFPEAEEPEGESTSSYQDVINGITKDSGRKLTFIFTQDSSSSSPLSEGGNTVTIVDPFSESKYEYSWGTCQKSRHASVAFIEALAVDEKLEDSDFADLVAIRVEALKACYIYDSEEISDWGDNAVITPYHDYLSGLLYLNQSNYVRALRYFEKMTKPDPGWFNSENNWLTETSTYLVGRMTLLESQREWDGDFDEDKSKIDTQLALQSLELFDQYLTRYPKGRYVLSAIGLKRRAYYLVGNMDAYAAEFTPTLEIGIKRLAEAGSLNQNDLDSVRQLIVEFSNRSVSYEEDEAILTELYETLFVNVDENKALQSVFIESTLEELEVLQSVLSEYFDGELKERDLAKFEKARLFELYLSIYARYWQQTKQYKTLIDNAEKYSDVFHYDSDPDILIAEALKSSGGLQALFDYQGFNNQFVVNSHINRSCDRDILEKIAFDKSAAKTNPARHNSVIESLSEFYLLTENFDQLNKLFTAYEEDSKFGIYAAIRTATSMVASKASLGKGYMNIGYLMANNSIGSYYNAFTRKCDEVAGEKSESFKDAFYYLNQALLTLGAKDQDRAKTYHFLVYCDRWLHCDKDSESERKRSRYWFKKLHTEFRGSKWAEQTPYYF